MMKKIVKLLSLLLLVFSLLVTPQPSYAQNDINIIIDGEYLQTDQPPIIQNSRTLVPLRSIFEALGAEVTWYQSSRSIYCYRDGTFISLTVDDNNAYINGNQVTIDQAPIIRNSRTLVPVRVVSEALDADVGWDNATRTVNITSNDGYVGIMRIDYNALLPDNLAILPPDIIGTSYVEGNYFNSTSYPILSYSLSYMDRGTTECYYLSNYDTVLSGEISPLLETFAPESRKISDIQYQKLNISFKTPYGDFSVCYDYALDEIEYIYKVS